MTGLPFVTTIDGETLKTTRQIGEYVDLHPNLTRGTRTKFWMQLNSLPFNWEYV